MNRTHQIKLKRAGLLGVVGGSLLAGFSVFAPNASAQVNPCPGIYYEEPFNSYVSSPEGCPLNARAEMLQAQPGQGGNYPSQDDVTLGTGSAPITDQPGGQNYPYEPYGQEGIATDLPPIARVEPMNGMVDVQLMNSTNIPIYYEVTGETGRRIISAQDEAYLQNISLPATITAVRTDDGLLQVIPGRTAEGTLELSLEEDPTFDDTQGVIRIQPDGQVFVN